MKALLCPPHWPVSCGQELQVLVPEQCSGCGLRADGQTLGNAKSGPWPPLSPAHSLQVGLPEFSLL